MPYTKTIGNKDLLYSLGKSIQYSVRAYMGKESEKRWIDVCRYGDSLCGTPETNTALSVIYSPIKFISLFFKIIFIIYLFTYFVFFGPHLWPMEVSRLGVESELQQPAYATAHNNTGSLTHRARPGIELSSSWILVRFVTAEARREHNFFFKLEILPLASTRSWWMLC